MSKQWHGGKGSGRRNSNDQAYADNWDIIFGDKKTKEKQDANTTSTSKQKKSKGS